MNAARRPDSQPRGSAGQVWAGWHHLAGSGVDLSRIAATDTVDPRHLFEDTDAEFEAIWRHVRHAFRELTEAQPGKWIEWTSRNTDALMVEVRAIAPKNRSFVAQWRVSEIIERGNQVARWRIPIPRLAAPLPAEESSPFEHQRFVQMTAFEPFVERFLESLEIPIAGADASTYWGRLFTSATVFGGLIRPRWLWALTTSLPDAKPDCTSLDLYDTAVGEATARHLRWYPDPLTRHLLVQARRTGNLRQPSTSRRDGTHAYRLIAKYCEAVGIEEGLPPNWRRLRDVLVCRLSLYVPPYLVQHAEGRRAATSLPPSVHERVLAAQPTIRTDVRPGRGPSDRPDGPQSEHAEEVVDDAGAADDAALWPSDLRELAAAVRSRDPADGRAVSEWLEKRRASDRPALLPSIECLAHWVTDWLCVPRRRGRKPRMRTVYARYNAVASRLVGQLGDTDPAQLVDPGDFRELYANAIEDTVSSSARKRVIAGLRSFHSYLVERHNAPQEASDELDMGPASGRRGIPDANYVDPISFSRVLTWVEHQQDIPATQVRLVQLMAVLGYYAGLRRSEAAGLLIGDVEHGGDYDLVIRANEHRALKSTSANRVLPMRPLLPRQYLAWLLAWQRRRRRELHESGREGDGAPLLAVPGREALRQRDRQLEIVTRALAQVTGDAGLRYHHLRHSFASRWLVLAWEHENGHARSTRHVPWISGSETEASAGTRLALLGDAPVQRRTLRLVARLLGHADTQITVEHYVHCLDDLLGRAVRRTVDHLSNEVIAGITGRSTSRVRAARRATTDGRASATLDLFTERDLPPATRVADTPTTDHDDRRAVQEPLTIAVPADPHERYTLFASAVNATASGSASRRVVYPWSRSTLDAATARAIDLPPGMRHRRNRTNDEGALIDPPRTRAEEALARRTHVALHGGEGQDGQAAVFSAYARDALLDAYRRGWRAGPLVTVRFETLSAAKHWARLLGELGIRDDFAATHIPARRSQAGSPRVQREHWMASGFEVHPEDPDAPGELERPSGSRGCIVVALRRQARHGRPMQLYGLSWALAVSYLGAGR